MLRRGLRLLLERRDFAMLMGAQFMSQAGDGLVQVALAKVIVFGGQEGFDIESARSPDEVLRIALYVFVPYTIVSPFLGVVIDRWDRRRLLIFSNALRAALIGAIGLVGIDAVGDSVLFVAFLLTISCTRAVLATKAAALPTTLRDDSLVEANAVSQLGGAAFQLGGAGTALIAAEYLEAEPIVIAGALVYGLGAVFASRLGLMGRARVAEALSRELQAVLGRIAAGVTQIARTQKASAAITTYFWLRLLWSYSLVAIGFVARELLADDDNAVVLVTGGAGAIGAGLGFLAARRLNDRARSSAQLVLSASTAVGMTVALLGPIRASAALAALAFCLGLGFFLAKISLDTMVQEALGDDFRGRAFSLYDIAYNLAWVIAAAAMKTLWSETSEGTLIAGMGLFFLAGVAALALWYRRAGLLIRPDAAALTPGGS